MRGISALQEFRVGDYFDGYILLFMKQVFHQCSVSDKPEIHKKNFCFILLASAHSEASHFDSMLEKYYPKEENLRQSLKTLHNLCQGNIDDNHKLIANKNELLQYDKLKKEIGKILTNKIIAFLVNNYRIELQQLGLYEISNLELASKEY